MFVDPVGGTGRFVRKNTAGVTAPGAEAATSYEPAVAFAENAADVATPDAFVIAVVTLPAKVPLAELPGALKVTVAPLMGLEFESLTITTSGPPNAVLTWVL